MNIDWFLVTFGSIIGSLILSILANLLTSPVQNRLATLSNERAIKRIEQLRKELSEATNYRDNPAEQNMLLLTTILRVLLVGALSGLITSFSSVIFNLILGFGWIDMLENIDVLFFSSALLTFVSTFFSLIIYLYTVGAIRIINRVRNYDNYRIQVESLIETLETSANQKK